MSRSWRIVVATVGLAFLACSQPEPTSIAAGLASADKQVVVSPSAVTLDVGGTQQFSAQFFQAGKQKKAAFTWSSSNTNVATVSSAGLVTAVGGGEATITATTSHTSGTAHVTVREAPPQPPQVVAHIPLGGGPFGSAVSSPGVGWVGQPSAGQVSRLDIAAGTITGTAHPGPFPVQISAKGDGSRIYVPSFFSFGMVTSTNTTTLATVDTVFTTENPEDAYGVTNMASGDTVFVGITNGPIFKVEMTSRTVLGRLDLPVAAGYHFEWNKNQTLLYASQRAFDGGRVFEINPRSFTLLRTFETGGAAQGIQLSADDSKLFVAAQNGGVIVWDVASNSVVTTYATPGCSGYGLLRTPDNTRLYVGCVFEGLVLVLDPTTGALIASVSVGGRPRELSYDASSKSLIVPNEAGWVDIIR
jgi:YVTN family beta-propeller protein